MARLLENLRAKFSSFTFRSLIPSKRFLILFASGIVTLVFLLTGSALYTSQPTFCTTCHYMEPFYESWEMSSHADVTCTQCHFPPGLKGTIRGKLAGLEQVISYVGRSYTRRKPWAEIDDASCLQSGCHETQLLEGPVVFKGVIFDHSHHLGELRRGKELRCTSCHSQVVQGEHLLVTESTCFLCHMKQAGDVDPTLTEKMATCKTCHDWEAVPADHRADFRFDHTPVVEQDLACVQCHNQTMIGDGFVPRENCSSCHFEPERLELYSDTALMHRVHISENKIECSQCHLAIQHKIQRLTSESVLDCSTCHSDTHAEQLSLFTGSDPHGDSGDPNPMLAAGLNCASCHLFHEQLIGSAEVRTAKPQSCESCHGEGYGRLLGLWEESANKKLADLRRELSRVRQTVQGSSSSNRSAALEHIQEATYTMQLVQVGKAVHNMSFSDQLIGTSYENLNNALAAIGEDYRLSGWDTDTVVPSECANCHAGVESITTAYRGRSFAHRTHVLDQSLPCQTCHSNAREHGQLVVSSQDCASCHHDPNRNVAVGNCATCHETVSTLYAGTYMDRDYPDFMFDEDVTCEDCHWVDNGVQRPQTTVCIDCHDDEYAGMADEWKADMQSLAAEIKTLLDQVPASFRSTEEFNMARTVLADLGVNAVVGIHNSELTMDLLSEIRSTLQAAIPESDD